MEAVLQGAEAMLEDHQVAYASDMEYCTSTSL